MASGNDRAAMAPGIKRRRVAGVLLAATVALAMTACGGSDNKSSSTNPDDGRLGRQPARAALR
jgi:hypothetical protein